VDRKQAIKEAALRAQRRKKIDAVEKFGGKCCLCGYKKCINALEFHHLGDKEEAPSYIIMRWSWEKAKKELEKCILVCANCHREIHYKDFDSDLRNFLKPFVCKKCKQCNKNFDTKNENQIFCSNACNTTSQHKVQRPSKEQLQELIQKDVPWVHLGIMFGVSDNAVRKWARKYELIQ